MKTPAEVVIDLMNETSEQTETRRALAKAQRESVETYIEDENDDVLSDRQEAHNDSWMCESDFY